jgi:hypothetical protein
MNTGFNIAVDALASVKAKVLAKYTRDTHAE